MKEKTGRNKMLVLAAQGKPRPRLDELAEAFGLSAPTVWRILKRYQVETYGPGRPPGGDHH